MHAISPLLKLKSSHFTNFYLQFRNNNKNHSLPQNRSLVALLCCCLSEKRDTYPLRKLNRKTLSFVDISDLSRYYIDLIIHFKLVFSASLKKLCDACRRGFLFILLIISFTYVVKNEKFSMLIMILKYEDLITPFIQERTHTYREYAASHKNIKNFFANILALTQDNV